MQVLRFTIDRTCLISTASGYYLNRDRMLLSQLLMKRLSTMPFLHCPSMVPSKPLLKWLSIAICANNRVRMVVHYFQVISLVKVGSLYVYFILIKNININMIPYIKAYKDCIFFSWSIKISLFFFLLISRLTLFFCNKNHIFQTYHMIQ